MAENGWNLQAEAVRSHIYKGSHYMDEEKMPLFQISEYSQTRKVEGKPAAGLVVKIAPKQRILVNRVKSRD
jgi:hypothetical protein